MVEMQVSPAICSSLLETEPLLLVHVLPGKPGRHAHFSSLVSVVK
jgi:hypothetical protein